MGRKQKSIRRGKRDRAASPPGVSVEASGSPGGDAGGRDSKRRSARGLWIAVGFLGMSIIACAVMVLYPTPENLAGEASPVEKFDATRAHGYLTKICRLGPRISGTDGMKNQQELLTEHFKKHGGQVSLQAFDIAHPVTGMPVRMANMIVSWNPDSTSRILLACHYDTRPYPDRDRRNPRGVFLGANDGASGVALFMELAHHMRGIESKYGVDFVLFDGEELIYGDRGKYFIGSEKFATDYRDNPPTHKYKAGVVVDMVADKNLNLYLEKNSLKYARDVTRSLWKTAGRLGVKEFHFEERHEVQDDHLPLNQIAGIPTCDVIDFDYPHWHTMQDVPANCSGKSLAKVAKVLATWVRDLE